MKEVEVKYKLSDVKAYRKLLENKGFRKKGREVNEDTYYTDPERTFIRDEVCLRLRKKKDETVFTFKPRTEKDVKVKSKEEIEFRVESYALMNKALKELGYVKAVSFTKERETYQRKGLKATIDYLKGIGWFTELEVLSDDEEKAVKEIENASNELSLRVLEKQNYRDLVIEHNKQSEESGHKRVH